MSSTKLRLALSGLAVVIGVLTSGCELGNASSTPPPTSQSQVKQDQQVEVVAQDGSRSRLPVVADNGQVVSGDSTRQADTPPVGSGTLLQRCKNVLGWDQLVTCVGNEQWYKDGFTRMHPYTGFTWDDVVKWSHATDASGKAVDSRVIHVYSMEISDTDARNAVRGLIGKDADVLPIVRHVEFVNSRGLEKEKVAPFVDRKKQVRVSLAPLILDGAGKVTNLRGSAGVFVDCLNIWGIVFAIATAPNQPALCPPGTGMAGKPIPPGGPKECTPPTKTTTPPPSSTPSCPAATPHGKPGVCKDGPDRLTTVGNGTGTNTGSGEYIPPAQMEQPPATSRTNQIPTTTKATSPPTVTPTVVPTQPTVVLSTQPTNTGTMPGGPGCGNPELC